MDRLQRLSFPEEFIILMGWRLILWVEIFTGLIILLTKLKLAEWMDQYEKP